MPVKCVGFDKAFGSIGDMERVLADEKKIGEVVLEKVEPMVQAVKDRIGTGSPWKESGLTRADIHASIDKESEVGHVKVAIGATQKNAFKVRLNEFGTSKQPAYPSLRPAHDETIGEVAAAIGKGITEAMGL